jgi:hypothetical protein
MRRASMSMAAAALFVLAGCGGGDDDAPGDGDGAGSDDGSPGGGDGGSYPGDGDDLDVASGCPGVYNPDQILEYHFETSGWSTLQNDCSYSTYVEAEMRCGDGPAIQVGMRHKRSGGTDKPGFKVDINHLIAGQAFNSLNKMSFENGISSGQDCGGDGDGGGASSLMTEYLAWRIHVLGGQVTGRAAFAKVYVNGDYIGTYVNVEQPDKVFLAKRLGDDDGWLYKVSGGDDGYKTNETMANPYEDWFCFLKKNPCAPPDDLESALPAKLDIEQILKVGAANALIGNHDGIMLKLNNYYAYDYASGPRMYFPWDLDSTMSDDYDVFTGSVSGGTTVFTDVLFAHWEEDYDRILTDWLAGPLSLDAIHGEIDRAVDVAGGAMADDPNGGGSAAAAGSDLKGWWDDRHAQVSQQVAEH